MMLMAPDLAPDLMLYLTHDITVLSYCYGIVIALIWLLLYVYGFINVACLILLTAVGLGINAIVQNDAPWNVYSAV